MAYQRHLLENSWQTSKLQKEVQQRNAFQTTTEEVKESSPSAETSPFTKEQLEHLHRLLSPKVTTNPSCSLAQKGTHPIASLCHIENTLKPLWIIDSGATDHMTDCSKFFSTYSPCAGNKKIKVADGSFSAIAGIGSIPLSSSLTLHNVLHVPNLSCNLLSVSKITHDLNCRAIFDSSNCKFQELNSRRMIGNAREIDGLYLFEDDTDLGRQRQSSCLYSSLISKEHEVMLWHYRLGHPSFNYMKHLFPSFFNNKNMSSFTCETCQLAKHHRSPYLSQPYKSSSPFSIIHSDVWGPSRHPTPSGKRWFVTFIDDHTRTTWVYLMRDKSEVESIVKAFFQMVTTQFHKRVQIFRSDNGKEFFNKTLNHFLLENGVVHQSSCVNTPQQNGVAERKNKHLLEVARSLLFQNSVPKYLWGEAVLTAAYLINRMPSKVLRFKTPMEVFLENFPNNRLLSTLPLKVFGCTVFVHNNEPNQSKLSPRAKKCVFIGYSPTQKGYKCLDPSSNKNFVTMEHLTKA